MKQDEIKAFFEKVLLTGSNYERKKNSFKIEGFKRNVILTIDSAELKSGSVLEKKERFKDIFQGKVNIIVRKDPTSRYFTYSSGCYHTEKRGNTTYDAWLN
jgi:hypothetical protein